MRTKIGTRNLSVRAQELSLARDDYVRIVASLRRRNIPFILGRQGEFMDAHVHENPRLSGNLSNAIHKLIVTRGSKRARKFWDVYGTSDANPDTTSSVW